MKVSDPYYFLLELAAHGHMPNMMKSCAKSIGRIPAVNDSTSSGPATFDRINGKL